MCELQSKLKFMLMLVIPIIICVFAESTSADLNVECYEEERRGLINETEVTSTSIIGRYTITWCPKHLKLTKGSYVDWELYVGTNDTSIKIDECPLIELTLQHSFQSFNTSLQKICSRYCLNTTLDLMYTGCYLIKNFYYKKRQSLARIYIENNYTKEHYNSYTLSTSGEIYNGTNLLIDLTSNNDVPLKDFIVEVKNINSTYKTESIGELKYTYSTIEPNNTNKDKFNCEVKTNFTVSCEVFEALKQTWNVSLKHLDTPWGGAPKKVLDQILSRVHSVKFSYQETSAGMLWRTWAVWVSVGAAVSLVAVGLLTKISARSRTPYRKQRCESSGGNETQSVLPPTFPVVVPLYERDHPLFMSAMTSLIHYIRERGLTVVDIHSPDTIAEMHMSGTVSNWVSRYIHDPNVYFLIVPSLAAHETLPPDLSRRRILKNMSPGSTALFEFICSLRLRADFPASRYLVAQLNIPGAPRCEVVPLLSPQLRVVLPGELERVVRDLPLAPDPCLHSRVSPPLQNYLDHLRGTPHYLHDYFME